MSGSCGCAEQEGRELIVGDVGDRGLGSILVVRFVGVSQEGREWYCGRPVSSRMERRRIAVDRRWREYWYQKLVGKSSLDSKRRSGISAIRPRNYRPCQNRNNHCHENPPPN